LNEIGRPDRRGALDGGFDGNEGNPAPERPLQDLVGGQVILVAPVFFQPPDLPQDVGHGTEVLRRFFPRRAGIGKPEGVPGSVR